MGATAFENTGFVSLRLEVDPATLNVRVVEFDLRLNVFSGRSNILSRAKIYARSLPMRVSV